MFLELKAIQRVYMESIFFGSKLRGVFQRRDSDSYIHFADITETV